MNPTIRESIFSTDSFIPQSPSAECFRRDFDRNDVRRASLTRMPLFTGILLLMICISLPSLNSACPSCEQGAFEEFKKARQEQILKDLLKKLDLPDKPNVTVDYESLRYIAPRTPRIQALIEQSRRDNHRRVRKQWGEGQDYYPALYETEQQQPAQTSFILAQGSPEWFDQDLPVALFKFSADLRKKMVTSARLNVFLRRPEQFSYGPVTTRLNVFQRFANGTLGAKLISKHLDLDFDEITAFEQVELPLRNMLVQDWIETGPQFAMPAEEMEGIAQEQNMPDENSPSTVGLYIEALYGEGENLVQYPVSGAEDEGTSVDALMFIELELVNLKSSRSRRNTNTCRPGSNHTKCCLYDLVIDFEKIGWSFVIAPKRYNAYVCSGECTGGVGSASQLMGRAQAALAAKIDHFQCCHPKEYNGITILFVHDNNNVFMKEVPNMVAKDCGCT